MTLYKVVFLYVCFAICGIYSVVIDRGPVKRGIVIESLHITSDIKYRFAATSVVSAIHNNDPSSQEARFDVRLPKEAFISNFTMVIDGVEYPGRIDERDRARKEYEVARRRGQSAAYVGSNPRNANNFKVSVNVAAYSNTTFELRYDELLHRRLGLYEHVVYVDPGVIIDDLRIEVFIKESRSITTLNIPAIRNDLLTDFEITEDNKYADVVSFTENSAHILFEPTPEQQREFSEKGISGQFIVNYDVDRSSDVGEILTVDGYFIHFFAPTDLKVLPKSIMFVLDTSGSMSGRKIQQMKTALQMILKDLREQDEFNIVTFSSSARFWRQSMVNATEKNVKTALKFGKRMVANGGTDINSALVKALKFPDFIESRKTPIIFFLTDGQPTSGITGPNLIIENVEKANVASHDHKVAIFCLAFGSDADFNLVRSISDLNNGISRKIYEDSDASLQLAGFYDEIGAPLLSDVEITYLDEVDPDSVTQNLYQNYFDGGELVVAGRLREGSRMWFDNNVLTEFDNSNTSVTAVKPTPDAMTPTRKIVTSKNEADEDSVNVTWTDPVDEKSLDRDGFNLAICVTGIDTSGGWYINETVPITPVLPQPEPERIETNPYRRVIQKSWAYLTVKQMIKRMNGEKDAEKRAAMKKRALDMSLKYHFVTPLTSMVVTKPEKQEVIGESSENELTEDASPIVPPRASFSSPGSLSPQASFQHQIMPMSIGLGSPGLMRPPIHQPARAYSYKRIQPISFNARVQHRSKMRATHVIPKSKSNQKKSTPKPSRKTPTYPPALSIAVSPLNDSICLDLPSRALDVAKPVSLINSTEMSLTARITKLGASGHLSKVTVFRSFVLTSNRTTIEVNTRFIVVNGLSKSWWSQLDIERPDGVQVVSARNRNVTVSTPDGTRVTVSKVGMQTRRSRSKPFLSLSASGEVLSENSTTGLIPEIVTNMKYPRQRPSQLSVRLWYESSGKPIKMRVKPDRQNPRSATCWRIPAHKNRMMFPKALLQYQM